MSDVAALAGKLIGNIEKVIIGKRQTLTLALAAYLCEGHVLLEDVPGVAKTMLARALAVSVGCTFKRLQCTPDLLPTDVTGVSIFNQKTAEFEFRPGPVFAQTLLTDEINRATPRTQSALLEAMSDRQVTVDGQTRPLGPPFIVLATQNPFEFEGTYPLPESQLDRFLLRLRIGYPARASEKEALALHRLGEPVERLAAVLGTVELLALQQKVRRIRFEDHLQDYLLDILDATRNDPQVLLGASIRAGLSLYRAAQALAMVEGREYVIPDDIKRLALPVLGHRLLMKTLRAQMGKDAADIFLQDVLAKIRVPV